MVWTIIIIFLSTADQLIKAVINNNLAPSDRITVIDGFFYIIQRHNSGAAWSFLAEPVWGIYILIAMSIIMTLLLIWILIRVRVKALRICLTLIISGSIGNMIDRIRFLKVTDYLDFHFGNYVFPTFNLADMLIVCGTILLCIMLVRDQTLVDAFFPVKKHTRGDSEKEDVHAAKHKDS
jgi:signal peptidase II